MLHVKVREPQFEGQTKTKLGNSEVETAVKTAVNEWLGGYPRRASARGEHRHREGGQRGARARGGAQGARPHAQEVGARRRQPARQARRLLAQRSGDVRDLSRRGRLGRRQRQAGARPHVPGDPAAARQDPERREGAHRQDPLERGDPHDHHGDRHRHQGRVHDRERALPQDHHHDRRRRGRRAHPHAAADLLLPADAGADRVRASSTSRSRRSSASRRGRKSTTPTTSPSATRSPSAWATATASRR